MLKKNQIEDVPTSQFLAEVTVKLFNFIFEGEGSIFFVSSMAVFLVVIKFLVFIAL